MNLYVYHTEYDPDDVYVPSVTGEAAPFESITDALVRAREYWESF